MPTAFKELPPYQPTTEGKAQSPLLRMVCFALVTSELWGLAVLSQFFIPSVLKFKHFLLFISFHRKSCIFCLF